MRIAIDAGHGMNTPGKRTPDGKMREFEFNAAVAEQLGRQLLRYADVEILYTHDRSGVIDVPLKERTDKANSWKADMLVSIHANAAGDNWSSAHGIETYAHSSRPTESLRLADAIQRYLIDATGRSNRGVKVADFHMLRASNMTSVLVECGFMSNREEAALLMSNEYRNKCAKAIADGIVATFALRLKPAGNSEVVVMVDGQVLPTSGYIQDGVTYVPVRAVAEALGATVQWRADERTVVILSN